MNCSSKVKNLKVHKQLYSKEKTTFKKLKCLFCISLRGKNALKNIQKQKKEKKERKSNQQHLQYTRCNLTNCFSIT